MGGWVGEQTSQSGSESVNEQSNSVTFLECDFELTLKVLVATIDAQWEEMGDVGSERYKAALLPPCPTIRVLSYSN